MSVDISIVENAIRSFHERVTEIERVFDTLNSVLYIQPESDFHNAINSLIGGYINALGAAYSINGWLEWWWFECSLGGSPNRAGLAGEELRTIETIDDLVKLICDDIKKAGQ